MKTNRKTTQKAGAAKAGKVKSNANSKAKPARKARRRAASRPTSTQIANLLERVSDGIVAFDAQMNYAYVNQKGGELLGRKPEDLVGKNYRVEYPEAKDTPFAKAYVRALETQETIVLEDYYAPFDRWFENRIFPSKEGLTIFFTEITGRKKAEQVVRESQERLARIVETIPDGITIVDREGAIVFANSPAERVLGLSQTDITQRSYNDPQWRIAALDGGAFPEEELPFTRVKAGGGSVYDVEHAIVYPDGKCVALSINASAMIGADGNFDGMVASITDITERKRAEAVIAERERQLSTLLGNLPGLAYRCRNDANFTTEFVSDGVAAMTGYSAADFREHRREFGQLIHPDDQEQVSAEIQAALKENRAFEMTYRILPATGEQKWVWERGLGIRNINGEVEALEGFVTDITERKRAEEKQRLSEERFSNAFYTSPAGLTITRIADGKFIEANESFCRIFEFSRDEVIGHTSTELNMWTPEERKKLIDEQIRSGGLHDFELQARAKSGRVVNILFSSKPMEIGGETHHITTMIDITERKRVEDALSAHHAELENLYATTPVGLALIDRNLRFLRINEQLAVINGKPMEAHLGRTVAEVLPELADVLEPIYRRVLDKGEAVLNVEIHGVTPAAPNILRDWLASYHPVTAADGSVTGVSITVLEITERKRAEAELQRNEQVLRLFVVHSPAAIAMFDREMRYIVASNRYLIDYELGEQNVVGRSHYEIFPEIPERWKEIHRRCLAGATERNEEDPFPRLSGKMDWVRWEIRPWYESSGEIGGVILFSEVITERKQAQEEIRISRERLADLSRRLVEAREAESRAIGRELHDQIGQMLTALKLTLEIAPQLPNEAAAKKYAQAQELLDDLMSRVSRLSLELRPPMLDDLGLIPALLWHVNRFQEQAHIAVDFHHSGVEGKRFSPEIETTAYRVVQEAFTNVARHARAGRARLEVRIRGDEMEIQIEDDGAGFDPQAAFAKHRGLSAMRERVQLVGGAVKVESKKGACIFITLPLRENP